MLSLPLPLAHYTPHTLQHTHIRLMVPKALSVTSSSTEGMNTLLTYRSQALLLLLCLLHMYYYSDVITSYYILLLLYL